MNLSKYIKTPEENAKFSLQVFKDKSNERIVRRLWDTLVDDENVTDYPKLLAEVDEVFLKYRKEKRKPENDRDDVDDEDERVADTEDDADEEEGASVKDATMPFLKSFGAMLTHPLARDLVANYNAGDVNGLRRAWSFVSAKVLSNCKRNRSKVKASAKPKYRVKSSVELAEEEDWLGFAKKHGLKSQYMHREGGMVWGNKKHEVRILPRTGKEKREGKPPQYMHNGKTHDSLKSLGEALK